MSRGNPRGREIPIFLFQNGTYKGMRCPIRYPFQKAPSNFRWTDYLLNPDGVGLGLGMLVADKINRPVRNAAAIALVSVGALAVVPLLVRAGA